MIEGREERNSQDTRVVRHNGLLWDILEVDCNGQTILRKLVKMWFARNTVNKRVAENNLMLVLSKAKMLTDEWQRKFNKICETYFYDPFSSNWAFQIFSVPLFVYAMLIKCKINLYLQAV